jgi:hypothetical protein
MVVFQNNLLVQHLNEWYRIILIMTLLRRFMWWPHQSLSSKRVQLAVMAMYALSVINTNYYFLNHEILKISTALSLPIYTYKCQQDLVEDYAQHLFWPMR